MGKKLTAGSSRCDGYGSMLSAGGEEGQCGWIEVDDVELAAAQA